MNEVLKQRIAELPKNSGVYVMRNKDGQVIYVGKAKNLKNRVSQYFNHSKKLQKVENMVSNVYSLDYFVTLSESDALALESNLIKKYQPFYNILLKDSKTFAYIKLSKNDDFPKFEITRKLTKNARFFGPYISGISAHEILKIINLAYPLRTCNTKINQNKPKERPCLNFDLGLCLAPCANKISKQEYAKIVNKAIAFLNGDTAETEKILQQKMLANSQNQNFEQALLFRDRLKMIEKLKEKTVANMPKLLEMDVFCFYTDNINSALSVIVCRGGKILGVQNYTIFTSSQTPNEIMSSFIMQYYAHTLVPKEILVNVMPSFEQGLQQSLFEKRQSKTNICLPQKGYKASLVKMGEQNAKNHLEISIMQEKKNYDNTLGALHLLQEKLSLKKLPYRIECYDISNTSGVDSVASMVVLTNGKPDHKSYRRFKIKTIEGPNDFGSMKEVMTRRLERLGDDRFGAKPDLIMLDGGKGQLSSGVQILEDFKKTHFDPDIEMISLAKQFEEVYLPHQSTPVMLDRNSKALKLLINLRDESHRFAITFHKNLHTKNSLSSFLDNLEGVGKIRRQNLLKTFKTTQKIKSATIDELMRVPSISLNLARNIYNQIHKEDNVDEQ